MEKMRRELGKEERCSDVLATADRERSGALMRFGRGRVGNVAHLGLGWLSENIAEVHEVLAELWLEWCWRWCSGELARARQSSMASLRLVLSTASVNASRARQGNANEGSACSRGCVGLRCP